MIPRYMSAGEFLFYKYLSCIVHPRQYKGHEIYIPRVVAYMHAGNAVNPACPGANANRA